MSQLILVAIHPKSKKVHAFGLGGSRMSINHQPGGWLNSLCSGWNISQQDDEEAPRWRQSRDLTCSNCKRYLPRYKRTALTEWVRRNLKAYWGVEIDPEAQRGPVRG